MNLTTIVRARQLRKKFEGHSLTVRNIVAQMSNEHLIEEYEFFHKQEVEATRVKNVATA